MSKNSLEKPPKAYSLRRFFVSAQQDTGNGFKSNDENTAVNIEQSLEKTGQVMDMEGKVIDNIAATDEQLKKEKCECQQKSGPLC